MSEDDKVAAEDVPVKEPPHVTAIRDAILLLLPVDPNIVSNSHVHDGVVDISLRWRSLRFSQTVAIAGRDAETIALCVDEDFRAWLRNTVKSMATQPKHSRVVAEMDRWLKLNPDKKAWLYGTKDEPVAEAAS